MRISGSGCLYTIDAGDQTVFPYSIGTGGQLTLTTNSTINTGATQLTSISTNGSFVYLTDTGASGSTGLILPYTSGTGCALNTLTGGAVANLTGASNPVYSLTDNKGKFLYVLNNSTTNSQNPTSSISAFSIDSSTGKLQALPIGDTNNPYTVGAGPTCMVEDPTSQYVYTSNNIAGTVTGKIVNSTTGQLNDLRRGATFPATGQATCLAMSPNVN
jgi:6-phosphogluconolactonase (cycloisomerase 2 family)